MITQSELKNILNYNPITGIFTWICTKNSYRKHRLNTRAGYIQKNKSGPHYRIISINSYDYKEHLLAHLYMKGFMYNGEMDHEDGNGTNNVWSNLRPTNRSGNQKNKSLGKNNKTGILGVSIRRTIKRTWSVQIKKEYLGSFSDFFEACCIRKSAELKYNFHANHGRSK